jgi:solute carrier family 50 protein (sugar transporter)
VKTPNAAGCFTGILQLAVYCIYSRCKEPTKILGDIEQANDMAMAAKP